MPTYLKALIHTILVAVTIHLVMLVLYAFTSGDIGVLNAFDIVDFDLFLPEITESENSLFLSWLFIALIYVGMFLEASRSSQKKSKKRNKKK